MKRTEVLARLPFQVPDIKKKRVIIHSDIAAEADDQFAIVHHLLTPSEDVVGIIAANFEWRYRTIGPRLQAQLQTARGSGMPADQLAKMEQSAKAFTSQRLTTMEQSYREGQKLLSLMEIDDVPLYRGAPDCITNRANLPVSEGARFIIEEAMRPCEEPLYIALQGTLTDLAVAYLTEPRIAERVTAAIWIGGGNYPDGGQESNLQQDIYAAQIVFDSDIPLWQYPIQAYAGMNLSFAELVSRVQNQGALGAYLAGNMFRINDWYGKTNLRMPFPHGELWSIGDQPTVAALLENEAGQRRHKVKAPHIGDDMRYIPNPDGREIYVYDDVDRRLLLEDFFAKLSLCYGKK